MLRPAAYEEITISSAAKKLTEATYNISGWGIAQKAVVQVLDAGIRVKLDGTDPSASTGFAESQGSSFALESVSEIINFRAIRKGGSDGKIIVTYYQKM